MELTLLLMFLLIWFGICGGKRGRKLINIIVLGRWRRDKNKSMKHRPHADDN